MYAAFAVEIGPCDVKFVTARPLSPAFVMLVPDSAKQLRWPFDTPWETILPVYVNDYKRDQRFQLIFSLMVYLGLTVFEFLDDLFTCPHSYVKRRVTSFLKLDQSIKGPARFGPLHIWKLWKSKYRYLPEHLCNEIVIPEAYELGRTVPATKMT
jgi:hypothetical protein